MKQILSIILIFLGLSGFSQDRIQGRNYQFYEGKVTAMDAIQVKLFTSLGKDTIINLTDIKTIKHQSGFVDRVSRGGLVHRRFAPRFIFSELKPEKFYRKNYFHMGLGNLVAEELSMGFERIVDQGKIGIKIPVKFNLNPLKYGYYNTNQELLDSYGLDVNFYPGKQGTFRFFAGIGFRTGSFIRGYHEERTSYAPFYQYSSTYHEYESNFRAVMLNTGIFIRPLTWLGVNVTAGLGMVRLKAVNDDSAPEEYQEIRRFPFPDVQLNLTIGI